MTIIEALNARSKGAGLYVTRKSWQYPFEIDRKHHSYAIKLMPTDSPDGFVLISASEDKPRTGWMPTLSDIIADDWITVY